MISKEERMEIARRLREADVGRGVFSPWCKMVEAILDGEECGEADGTCDEKKCCERFMATIAAFIEPEHRKCEHCGAVYYPKTKEQRYCSKKCKQDRYISERLRNEGEIPEFIAKVYGLEVDVD